MSSTKATSRLRKLTLWWGGATVSALVLAGGSVVYALDVTDNPDAEGSAKAIKHCASVLEGLESEYPGNLAVSDSGEHIATDDNTDAGHDLVIWKDGEPSRVGDLGSFTVRAVNSEGAVAAEQDTDDGYRSWVYDGQERHDLLPPDGMETSDVFVTDISDSGIAVGYLTPKGGDSVPAKWDDPTQPGTVLPLPDGSTGEAEAITADDVIVGDAYVDGKSVGWYWNGDDNGELGSFPRPKLYPRVVDAEGDWAVTKSTIDSEGPQYYHRVPITGSGKPVSIPLSEEAEMESQINVDAEGRAYGSDLDGAALMVVNGKIKKLDTLDGTTSAEIDDVSTDGGVLVGLSDTGGQGSTPTVWRAC